MRRTTPPGRHAHPKGIGYALFDPLSIDREPGGRSLARLSRTRGLAGGILTRTGLLGGSFNPAHRGHRAITLAAIRTLALDEAWWLVSPGNPLKPAKGMAPLAARLASARVQARRAPIRPTAIEAKLGTRYTVDTIRKLQARYPKRRFIWLMGGDNLAQFHRWRDWRRIARLVPIAVIARPGYDGLAFRSPAFRWFGRFVRPARDVRSWTDWRLPALVLLRFRPDPTSATALRLADPNWSRRYAGPSSQE